MLNDNDFLRHRPQLKSRSINAENPDGRPGGGGLTSSALGPGRKGRPLIDLPPGEPVELASIDGPGCIRHIWITVPRRTETSPFVLRDLVLRAYWDGADQPAIEVPLGDFFCCGFGAPAPVTSIPITVGSVGGLNSYWPMPFGTGARIVIENQGASTAAGFFYQIDYTLGDVDDPAAPSGRLHAQWRRSNGTTALGEDHTIVDGIHGAGSYVGTYLAIAQLSRYWYGEGELKFRLDGEEHPTICGTGTEDYVGGAWAFQETFDRKVNPMPIPFNGPYCGYIGLINGDTSDWSDYALVGVPSHGMYRWHLPDPIRFDDSLNVTLQQIGHDSHVLFERSDDISSVAYWYQFTGDVDHHPLPPVDARRPR